MKNKKRRLSLAKRRDIKGLVFMIPWLVGFGVFFARPLFQAVIYSFHNITITGKGRRSEFVEWLNYSEILTRDLYFTENLRQFYMNTLFSLPIVLVFSLLLAMLINQRIRAKGLFRAIFFLPIIVTSGPVMAMLTEQGATTIPLIEQYGLLYTLSDILPYFLVEPISNLLTQLIMILWYSGVPILIFLAGLQKIDTVLYEAALIDGASSWVVFWKITLPSLRSMVLINAIYTLVFLATSETNAVTTLIKNAMLQPSQGYGIATAMAWIYSLSIALVIGLLYLLLGRTRKTTEKHAIIRKRQGVTGRG